MNVRELRREELSTGLVQQTLPEIEWRGRSHKLGRTPLYLAFESSLASIQQRRQAFTPDYLRGDAFPTLSLPVSPVPWLDITPRASYRLTHYTQRLAADGTVEDEPLTRRLWSYGVELVGPKLVRIYGPAGGDRRWKHAIEPRIGYGFDEGYDESERIISYDDVDAAAGSGNEVRYALVQRLFGRRPQSTPAPPPVGPEIVVLPDGTADVATAPVEPQAPASGAAAPPSEPVEIASLELGQTRSFDRDDVSTADLDRNGTSEAASPYSPIRVVGRFNPGPAVSLDLRSTYDILWDRFRDMSLSGNLRNTFSTLRFSLFHRNGLGVESGTLKPIEDSTQVRLTTGVNLLQNRIALNFDGAYDADPPDGEHHFPDQRWQVQYRTQCCTVLVERLTRAFGTPEDRRELYVRVDLTGIGKLFDQSF
jgi:hypothetical protein